jgi:dTMP kinase
MLRGKLIVIESGSDASGKATQASRLFDRLTLDGFNAKKVEFPNYKSESSSLIKMYLNGDFGKSPEDVNPYVASTFYAVDRYASFKTEWGDYYKNGGVIIADRYTTSNMVHQASKMNDNDKGKFLDWLWDFEFNLFKLPVPDLTVFLDMPPDFSQKLMEERLNKYSGKQEKDIHERNKEYLVNSYNNALYVADRYNWTKITCVNDGVLRTIDDIHEDIYSVVRQVL